MSWSAWSNGKHHHSGVGYGLKIPIRDRDAYFRREWESVVLELPTPEGTVAVELSISKPSFWNRTCHELISKEVGIWLRERGLTCWPKRLPPKLIVTAVGERRFRVHGIVGQI